MYRPRVREIVWAFIRYLLMQQPDDNRTAIKTAVTSKVRDRFADGGKWRAPIPASLIVAKTA